MQEGEPELDDGSIKANQRMRHPFTFEQSRVDELRSVVPYSSSKTRKFLSKLPQRYYLYLLSTFVTCISILHLYLTVKTVGDSDRIQSSADLQPLQQECRWKIFLILCVFQLEVVLLVISLALGCCIKYQNYSLRNADPLMRLIWR